MSSIIQKAQPYSVFECQLICCVLLKLYVDLLSQHKALVTKILLQGYKVNDFLGGNSVIKVGMDVQAQALGISGVNFCLGIRSWEVNFARALGFGQCLAKNV